MTLRSLFMILPAIVLSSAGLRADEGNGEGNAFLTASVARIGGQLEIRWGSPSAPNGVSVLIGSGSLGTSVSSSLPFTLPINRADPDFQVVFRSDEAMLNSSGEHAVVLDLAPFPLLVNVAPFYVVVLVPDPTAPSGISLPKTLRIQFANSDSFHETDGSATFGRSLHTATALYDGPRSNRQSILIAGGGDGPFDAPTPTDSTEIYDIAQRMFSAGPFMNSARALHRAVRLDDGRVLIVGGMDVTLAGTASCEIYDPATGTMTPVASMNEARFGHGMSKLADGRVLVTGGMTSFVGAPIDIVDVFDNTVDTAEIYDPITDIWTPTTGFLTSPRAMHTQTTTADGRVLLTGGANGTGNFGGLATIGLTRSTEFFDEGTLTFIAGPQMAQARMGHAASVLGNGEVLVSGGIRLFGFLPAATSTCEVLDVAATNWSGTTPLPNPAAFHTQRALADGTAWIAGGFEDVLTVPNPLADSGRHDGSQYLPGTPLMTNIGILGAPIAPRGGHEVVELPDGSYLLVGGNDDVSSFTEAFVYTP